MTSFFVFIVNFKHISRIVLCGKAGKLRENMSLI